MNWAKDDRDNFEAVFSNMKMSVTTFRGKFYWTVMLFDEQGNGCLVGNGSSNNLDTAKSEAVSFARSYE